MTFTPYEANIANFLNSTTGPVGNFIARKASLVEEAAAANAAGPVIGIRSGELRGNLRVQMIGTPEGAIAHVGTNAVSAWKGAPFSYPRFWENPAAYGAPDVAPRPWLTLALRAVFPVGG